MEKINEISNYLSNCEKLDINTAKVIYIMIRDERDLVKRKALRARLISGTLYVVYNYIQNHSLFNLTNSIYDIDDIINASCEAWIKLICNGKILEINSYSLMFNSSFFTELGNSLGIVKYDIGANTILSTETFTQILTDYFELKSNNHVVKYEDFLALLSKNNVICDSYLCEKFKFLHSYLMELFDTIYESLIIEEKNLYKSNNMIDRLKYFLLNNAIEKKTESIDNVIVDDHLDEYLTQKEFFRQLFNSNILNDKEKELIKKRFGLYEFNKTVLEELALDLGLTKERVRQIEQKCLAKIRQSDLVRKQYKNMY